ncbi:MAG: SRPBCC family protein [Streptosporangiaceae bacterium]|jgi:uncharacterized protein YndB with AHSA1/START domain
MWTYEHTAQTDAAPERLWRRWANIAGWPEWNAGIGRIRASGPLAVGTTISFGAPDEDDDVTVTITELTDGQSFTDQAVLGDAVIRTIHRVEPLDDGGARVLYRTEIDGPAELAEQIGPAITGDFPDVVAALISQC